jgi:hypothetical protein
MALAPRAVDARSPEGGVRGVKATPVPPPRLLSSRPATPQSKSQGHSKRSWPSSLVSDNRLGSGRSPPNLSTRHVKLSTLKTRLCPSDPHWGLSQRPLSRAFRPFIGPILKARSGSNPSFKLRHNLPGEPRAKSKRGNRAGRKRGPCPIWRFLASRWRSGLGFLAGAPEPRLGGASSPRLAASRLRGSREIARMARSYAKVRKQTHE